MLMMTVYCKMEGWYGVKSFLAYFFLSLAAFYVLGLLIIAAAVAGCLMLAVRGLFLLRPNWRIRRKQMRLNPPYS